MTNQYPKIFIVGLFLLPALPVYGAKDAEPLFQSEETVGVTFTAPWHDVEHDKGTGSWPATISWTDDAGQPQTLELEVERRGKSRLENCNIPPIKMRFDKRIKDDGLFHKQKNLKLVTHCKKSEKWQQYYILEMLAYRIYNLMTDYSFRVRPFEVVYMDNQRDDTSDPRFAFVIEDDKAVAKRHDLKKIEIEGTQPGRLNPLEASRLALFQLLIGNVDWSAIAGPDGECCHNVKLIGGDPETDPIIALPYDFDASGFVDPPYAEPNSFLPVRSVTDRLYRGYCAHNSTLEEVRQQFRDGRTEVFAIVENEPRLTNRYRKKAIKYLESYYEILDSDEAFQEEVVSQCRG